MRYVPIDAYRFGRENIKDVNFEGKQKRESKEWVGTRAQQHQEQSHMLGAAHGGVCAIAAKVMEIETKPGMGDSPSSHKWGETRAAPCNTGSSLPRATGGTKENIRMDLRSCSRCTLHGTHRQDMQDTNVEVKKRDGHRN